MEHFCGRKRARAAVRAESTASKSAAVHTLGIRRCPANKLSNSSASSLKGQEILHPGRMQGIAMSNRCTAARASDRIWTRVMREGVSVEEAASEFGVSTVRLEQVLIAFGRRRIARETRDYDSDARPNPSAQAP